MKKSCLLVAACCLSASVTLFSPSLAMAGVFTFYPTGQSYVYSYWNYSGFEVGESDNFFPDPYTVSYSYQEIDSIGTFEDNSNSFLIFDLGSALVGADIVSASLNINILQLSGDSANAAATFLGTTDNLLLRSSGPNAIDVTSLVVAAGASDNLITLSTTYLDPSHGGIYVAFDSRFTLVDEDGNYIGPDPYLKIETRETAGDPVPEPATLILLGSGLLGLAGMRRMKRK